MTVRIDDDLLVAPTKRADHDHVRSSERSEQPFGTMSREAPLLTQRAQSRPDEGVLVAEHATYVSDTDGVSERPWMYLNRIRAHKSPLKLPVVDRGNAGSSLRLEGASWRQEAEARLAVSADIGSGLGVVDGLASVGVARSVSWLSWSVGYVFRVHPD